MPGPGIQNLSGGPTGPTGPTATNTNGMAAISGDTAIATTGTDLVDSGALAAGTYHVFAGLCFVNTATTSKVFGGIFHTTGTTYVATGEENAVPASDESTMSFAANVTITANEHLVLHGVSVTAAATAKLNTVTVALGPATYLGWIKLA